MCAALWEFVKLGAVLRVGYEAVLLGHMTAFFVYYCRIPAFRAAFSCRDIGSLTLGGQSHTTHIYLKTPRIIASAV